MAEEMMRLHYDPKLDLLEVSIGEPQEAVSEVSDDIFFHFRPDTNQVVGFTVLNLRHRFELSEQATVLPIIASFVPAPV